MKILWIVFDTITRTPEGQFTSSTASIRYRVIAPLEYLVKQGVQATALVVASEELKLSKEAIESVDVAIFSKSFFGVNEQLAAHLKERGVRVIFDVCDPHFEHPNYGAHYVRMATLADKVTVNTEVMAEVAARHTQTPVTIIPDPVMGSKAAARFNPQPELIKLLWFGYPTNLDSLAAAMPDLATLAREGRKVALTLCTQLSAATEDFIRQCREQLPAGFTVQAEAWSQEKQRALVEACDMVVIPSLDITQKRTKSSNRLVEPLYAGRMVVAHPMPAYLEFKDYACVGAKLSDGVEWCLQQRPKVIEKRIEAGQDYIARTLSQEAIGKAWLQILST